MLLLLGIFIYSILIILFAFYGGVAFEYYSPSFNGFVINWDVIGSMVSAFVAIITMVIIACQTILSRKSIQHMENQNKISADSVNEMKKQNGLIRDLEYKKLEMLDLKQFINEKITPYIKEYKQGKTDKYDSLDIKLIEKTNLGIWTGLVHLTGFAINTFYNKSILEFTELLFELSGATQYPIDFSHNTKLEVSLVLTKIGDNLYKILIDEQTRNEWKRIVQEEKKDIYEQLTPEEKEKIELHTHQFVKQIHTNQQKYK